MLFPHGKWLLCPPTFFDVTYEINPWMDVDRAPHSVKAASQWKELHHTLIRLGAYVEYIEPTRGNPDLVFTANAGLVKGKKFVLSRFRHKERRGEEPFFDLWFRDRGYHVSKVSTGYFEGEGDSLFVGETLFCGYGFRSEAGVYDEVAKCLGIKKKVLCELIDPRFYHLDTCFCPLNESQAIYFPDAFSEESAAAMKQHAELFPVPKKDAEKFVCNAVVLGKDIVLPAGCKSTYKILEDLGYKPYGIELGEFLKGGGSAKCLSLKLEQ
jgi:N-dimethylarginine dimethylaminohydrolase